MGVGLRVPHLPYIFEHTPAVDFFELISENFMVDGGPPLRTLGRICERYPVVLHGVSMGLGSAQDLDAAHLERLVALARRTRAPWVSEHLCWTRHGDAHLHDLLPLPYTDAVARFVADKAARVQGALGVPFAIENLSSYVGFQGSQMPEWAFYRQVVEQADCFMMLDVNNIWVSSVNHGFDPWEYLAAMPWERVIQVHVAGHTVRPDGTLLDTHDHPVRDEVWALYAYACQQTGGVSTILEWDDAFLSFPETLAEADKARRFRGPAGGGAPVHSPPPGPPAPPPPPSPPSTLARLQGGFARSIRVPLRIEDDGYRYQVERYDPEVVAQMVPGPTLGPVERLSVYNQQYWFRLLTLAQEELPLVRALLGLPELNRLATAYLDTFPSAQPELHHLLERLPAFLAAGGPWSTPLLRQAVDLDLAWQGAFFAARHQDLDPAAEDPAVLLGAPLAFQGGLSLLAQGWPLVALRRALLARPQAEQDAPVPPPAPAPGWWAVYRSRRDAVAAEPLTQLQHGLLRSLQAGETLTEALAAVLRPDTAEELAGGLQAWFARWAGLGWFRAGGPLGVPGAAGTAGAPGGR